jgi:hypothetical protein
MEGAEYQQNTQDKTFQSKTKSQSAKRQVMDTSKINTSEYNDMRSMRHLSMEAIVQHYIPAKVCVCCVYWCVRM